MPTTFDVSIYSAVHDLAAAPLAPLESWGAQWLIFAVPIVLICLWIRNDVSDRKTGIRAGISAAVALAVSGIVSFFVFEPPATSSIMRATVRFQATMWPS
jgi:undecaprenyl-diphosphatase